MVFNLELHSSYMSLCHILFWCNKPISIMSAYYTHPIMHICISLYALFWFVHDERWGSLFLHHLFAVFSLLYYCLGWDQILTILVTIFVIIVFAQYWCVHCFVIPANYVVHLLHIFYASFILGINDTTTYNLVSFQTDVLLGRIWDS